MAALRYFNAAGADPDLDIGEVHRPETHLIPLLIDAAYGGEPVTIHGSDYDTPDGTCIRDYIHVSDLADAHVSALVKLQAGRTSRVYNLGTDNGHSVRDVIDAVEKVTGRSVPVKEGPRRPGDPPALVASAERARAHLDWKPRHIGIEQIVQTAAAWHRKRSSTIPHPE